MKAMRVAIGLMLAAGAAGCTSSSSPILPAADPSFDGGHTLGSGAGVPTPPENQSTSSEEGGHTIGGGAGVPQAPPETQSTTSADTTGRGGHTIGGGARVQESAGQEAVVTDTAGRSGHTLGSGS